EEALGVPVVETVAVHHNGAKALVERIEALGEAPQAPTASLAVASEQDASDALHAETRRLLSLAVEMPSRTARIDDMLDRWLLHPVAGLLVLAVLMFLIFQAVYAWATPVMDGIDAGTAWVGEWVAGVLPEG